MSQKDNSTLIEKRKLRQIVIAQIAERGITQPAIMETHGGSGVLFDRCYAHVTQGVVFEKDTKKAATLAMQRPTWAVYECHCEPALAAGVGGHLVIDLLDVDPYGSCWEAVEAFFASTRPFAEQMWVVVNDGLRQMLAMHQGWQVEALCPAVEQMGNAELYAHYLEACELLLSIHAKRAGYTVGAFHGYHCGHKGQITHFLAELRRQGA